MAIETTGGGSGTALDAALATLKTATPEARKAHLIALRAVMDEAGDPKEEKKAEDEFPPKDDDKDDKKSEDSDEDMKEDDKKDAKDSDLKMDDIAKRPNAMDAAEIFKTVTGEIKRRDALAKQLAAHIGTFDHSDMTEAEVAAYGAGKLGIKTTAGQEAAVLQGYLMAASKTAAAPAAKTATAMDSSKSAGFVSAFLNHKEG